VERAPEGQEGAALITVLAVLATLGIVVALLLEGTRPGIKAWAREADEMQALYLAESGIGYQLYLERFSDSAEPAFGPALGKDSLVDFLSLEAPRDSFAFRLDTGLATPDVRVDRTRSFLDMRSTASHNGQKVTLQARFGKTLDDSVFGPALTLDNDVPVEPFSREQVNGTIRLRTASPGVPSLPWPDGLSLDAYAAQFTDSRYYALESALQNQLSAEGGESGNGYFDPDDPPDFAAGKDIVFPLGKAELRNDDDDETWVVRGPGRIYAEQEIRIKGNIRLERIHLLSARDITFEDSVSGAEITVYARGSVFIHGRCHMEVEAVAGKDIILRDRSQTAVGSVLLSVGSGQAGKKGGKPGTKGPDSLNAIRVVNQARARGFLIAGGANGRVALATVQNRVEGVIMAQAVWLGGTVHGPVLAKRLLCEGTQARNCLGPGVIDRARLPVDFVQPLQLGPEDRRTYRFKLMEWKRL
jgi:hypothetical protein